MDLTRLTPTQRAIVNLLSHGYGTRGAAAFLGISPDTVSTHISNALLRSHAENREHLVAAYVREEQVLRPDLSLTLTKMRSTV